MTNFSEAKFSKTIFDRSMNRYYYIVICTKLKLSSQAVPYAAFQAKKRYLRVT